MDRGGYPHVENEWIQDQGKQVELNVHAGGKCQCAEQTYADTGHDTGDRYRAPQEIEHNHQGDDDEPGKYHREIMGQCLCQYFRKITCPGEVIAQSHIIQALSYRLHYLRMQGL